MSQFRISPPRIFPAATRSSRPPAEAAGSADAYRQTSFILGAAVELVVQGLDLEAGVARRAGTSAYRNHTVASAMATWSRSWLERLQALHAVEWGNYPAAIALVHSSALLLRSTVDLVDSSAAAWVSWLDSGGIVPAHEEHATEVRFDATPGITLASAWPGARVAEEAALLSGPAFATTVLLSAPESTPARIAAVFGDRDFNVALAELSLAWLITLSESWLGHLATSNVFPPVDSSAHSPWQAASSRELARRDRCRIETDDVDGVTRNVIRNWRRSPGGAPRRILL